MLGLNWINASGSQKLGNLIGLGSLETFRHGEGESQGCLGPSALSATSPSWASAPSSIKGDNIHIYLCHFIVSVVPVGGGF